MNEPIYRLLGLCMKAGRLLSGSEQIKTAVKDGKGILLILAEDSSERTKEEYIRLAKLSGITWRIFGEKEKLGHAVGKGIRAAILIWDVASAKDRYPKINRDWEVTYAEIQNI